MINTLRMVMKKVGNLQKEIGNVGRDIETLRKNQNKIEIKDTVIEMKSAFDGLIGRLDTAKTGVSEPDDMSL